VKGAGSMPTRFAVGLQRSDILGATAKSTPDLPERAMQFTDQNTFVLPFGVRQSSGRRRSGPARFSTMRCRSPRVRTTGAASSDLAAGPRSRA